MPKKNIIIVAILTNVNPSYPLCVTNQAELMTNSNVNQKLNEQAHLSLVLNP